MTIAFDEINKLIIVELPATEVTCQELLNAIREHEADLMNLDLASIATASGKEEVGTNLFTGITLRLIDWKVKFADREPPTWITCEIKGGNLLCWDTEESKYVNPIEPAAYVTAVKTAAVSAVMVASDYEEIADNVWDEAFIEHQSPGSMGKLVKSIDQNVGDIQGLLFGA